MDDDKLTNNFDRINKINEKINTMIKNSDVNHS